MEPKSATSATCMQNMDKMQDNSTVSKGMYERIEERTKETEQMRDTKEQI
jgi:hypothetical protein